MRWFPKKFYQISGIIQIILGLLMIILCVVGIVETKEKVVAGRIAMLGATSWWSAIFCGLLAVIAGCLAVASTNTKRMYRREGLKHGAAILSMMLAVLVAWSVAVIFFAWADYVWSTKASETIRALMVIVGVCALLIWILALFTAITFCCCSPYENKPKEQSAMYNYAGQQMEKPYEVQTQALGYSQPGIVTPGYVMHTDVMHLHH